jgi:hypothetical protein
MHKFDPATVSSMNIFTCHNPDELVDSIKLKLVLQNNTSFKLNNYLYSITFNVNNIGHKNKIQINILKCFEGVYCIEFINIMGSNYQSKRLFEIYKSQF